MVICDQTFRYDQFDFLIDIVPREDMKPASAAKSQREELMATGVPGVITAGSISAAPAVRMMPEQVTYYFQQQQQQQQQHQAVAQPAAASIQPQIIQLQVISLLLGSDVVVGAEKLEFSTIFTDNTNEGALQDLFACVDVVLVSCNSVAFRG